MRGLVVIGNWEFNSGERPLVEWDTQGRLNWVELLRVNKQTTVNQNPFADFTGYDVDEVVDSSMEIDTAND
jgi:hypothetical protein